MLLLFFMRPDGNSRFESVHIRHLNVHQNQVIVEIVDASERFNAIGGAISPDAELIQLKNEDVPQGDVVFNHKDSMGTWGIRHCRTLAENRQQVVTAGLDALKPRVVAENEMLEGAMIFRRTTPKGAAGSGFIGCRVEMRSLKA
jgi:hypothetical protein